MADLLELLSLPIVTKEGNASKYFEDAWYQLIEAIGGEGAAPVDDTTNKSSVRSFPAQVIDTTYLHAVSANYTTIGNEIIDCSGTITITLNASPDDREQVKVSHQGSNGDIISITDGTGTDYLHVPGDSVIYCYSVDLGRWL